jgi:hypothetical protein
LVEKGGTLFVENGRSGTTFARKVAGRTRRVQPNRPTYSNPEQMNVGSVLEAHHFHTRAVLVPHLK